MVKKQIDLLLQLQEIDLERDSIKSAKSALQKEIDAINAELEAANAALEALTAKKMALASAKADHEKNLADEQENIRRSESNMKEIKTNKEYQAVGKEIAAARKQVAAIEELIISNLSEVEETEKSAAEATANLESLKLNSDERIAEKNKEIDAIDQDLEKIIQERENLAKQLPMSLSKRYEMLRTQRMGKAVAVASEGYCLACNMSLPPQLYNNLFKCDELLTCPHCSRVLVLKQQPQQ